MLKKILITLIVILAITSCSRYVMLNSINKNFNLLQIDSICKVEKIPSSMDKWISNGGLMVDEETRDTLYQWLYIKQLQNKKNNEVIYIIKQKDKATFNFTKRVIIKDKQ